MYRCLFEITEDDFYDYCKLHKIKYKELEEHEITKIMKVFDKHHDEILRIGFQEAGIL